MNQTFEIREYKYIEEMISNLALLRQLTPSLTEQTYLAFLKQMVPHNYYQVVVLYKDQVIGVSGYWIATKLYCGRYLEIDNFVVDENFRSQKVGDFLLKKLEEIAKEQRCDVMMLDAYLHNTRAHKFYEDHNFQAKGYHFISTVSGIPGSNECMS